MTENAAPAPVREEGQFPVSDSRPQASGPREAYPPKYSEGTDSSATTPGYPGFLSILALFLAFRLLTLFLLRPGGFIRDWSDFDTYLGIAALSDYGLYPFLHFWLEWPPLVPWLSVAVYKLSLLFPPWTDHRLWFILILGSIFVLFETGNFVLVYRIARRLSTGFVGGDRSPAHDMPTKSGPGQGVKGFISEAEVTQTGYALRVVVIYALLFAPIYAMLGFFDTIALFFLLLALDLILSGRLLSSAISVGIGFLVKVTPVIFIPIALRRLWDEAEDRRAGLRDGALYLVTNTLTILVLLLPFLVTNPIWLWTALRAIFGRSSWDTVWAVLEGYFGFGMVGGDRLNPAETAFAVHDGNLPWWLISLGFGLLYLILWTRRADYHRPLNVVALTGLTVTLFLLYSKGYSPQFLVYLLPFIILLFPNARGVTYSLLLTLLNVLEQPIYFVFTPDAAWLLEGVIVARWLVLGALLVEFGWVLWGTTLRRLARLRRYAPAGLSILVGLGLVISLPALGRAYAERRLSEEPAASLIGYLSTEQAQAQAKVLFVTDQDLLRRISPYLGGNYSVRLAGGDALYEAAPSVGELFANVDRAWVLASGERASDVERAISTQGRSLLTYRFGDGGNLRLFAPYGGDVTGGSGPTASEAPLARLANGANLVGYAFGRPARDQVRVTLYWWAARRPTQNYTVFTQVLDGDGVFVAGHDSRPAEGAAPTQSWIQGQVYADTHLIQLPEGLPSGSYNVVAGMYDFSLNRLVATGPDASVFRDNAVPLGGIKLP